MSITWHELGLAIAQAEAPSITLQEAVAQKLNANPRTRYMQDFAAARSVLPQGWGYILDASPGRDPYCDALGNVRVGSTGKSDLCALLAAACMAQSYQENAAIRRQRELEQLKKRQPAPAQTQVLDDDEHGTLRVLATTGEPEA